MSNHLDGIQLLTRLGLTSRQAKVYLTLLRYGTSTVKEISKNSNVPREDLYRILQTLQNTGLIEKRITFPVTFAASPLRDALSFLHQRRINEATELQAEAKRFLEVSMANLTSNNHKEEPQFVLVPEKEAIIARRKKSIINAKHSIDVVNSASRHAHAMRLYADEINQTLARGAKARVIIHKSEGPNSVDKSSEKPKDSHNLTVRYALASPSAFISIYDKKEVFMVIDESADLGKSPALWSTNPSLLALAQSYFDMLWQSSVKKNNRNIEPVAKF